MTEPLAPAPCREENQSRPENPVRKLASIQTVNAVEPIPNADAIEKVRVLGWWVQGTRNTSNNVREIDQPSDYKGLKIRTMESPTHLAIWRDIGANPTPMAWPITTQLQQGVLDGQENPISVISAAKLNEAGQKYLTLTRHVYSALVFVGSKAFMDKLPAADRKVFMEAAKTASLEGRRVVRENEAKQLAALEAAGMKVVTNPDLAAFRAKTEPVYASLTGETKKIVEQIRKSEK